MKLLKIGIAYVTVPERSEICCECEGYMNFTVKKSYMKFGNAIEKP